MGYLNMTVLATNKNIFLCVYIYIYEREREGEFVG